MNSNWLAKRITELEGLKVQVNIAQVKEIIRVMRQIYKEESCKVLSVLVGKSVSDFAVWFTPKAKKKGKK